MGRGWNRVRRVTDRKGHDRRYSLDDSRLQAARLRAWYLAGGRAVRHRALVPGEPALVAAAEGGLAQSRAGSRRADVTRWLVTGAGGMLGRDVIMTLRTRNQTVLALSREELDITSATAVGLVVTDYRPDVVVNCAAWTAVDAAEAEEARALSVNGEGARNLAARARRPARVMAQISTDYVFAGEAGQPYGEPTSPRRELRTAAPSWPASVPCSSLLPDDGLVIRTAWLYGGAGPSFVHTMIRLAGVQQTVDVVADQHGQPSWTADVAEQVIALAECGAGGIYHATSAGLTTWFELACEVFELLGTDPGRVRPTSSDACHGRRRALPGACSVTTGTRPPGRTDR